MSDCVCDWQRIDKLTLVPEQLRDKLGWVVFGCQRAENFDIVKLARWGGGEYLHQWIDWSSAIVDPTPFTHFKVLHRITE